MANALGMLLGALAGGGQGFAQAQHQKNTDAQRAFENQLQQKQYDRQMQMFEEQRQDHLHDNLLADLARKDAEQKAADASTELSYNKTLPDIKPDLSIGDSGQLGGEIPTSMIPALRRLQLPLQGGERTPLAPTAPQMAPVPLPGKLGGLPALSEDTGSQGAPEPPTGLSGDALNPSPDPVMPTQQLGGVDSKPYTRPPQVADLTAHSTQLDNHNKAIMSGITQAAMGRVAAAHAAGQPPAPLDLMLAGKNPKELEPPPPPSLQHFPAAGGEMLVSPKTGIASPMLDDTGKRVQPAPPASVSILDSQHGNIADTAKGIRDGTLPPTMANSTRPTPASLALSAELQRSGTNVSSLIRDWTATMRAVGTMNGQQQQGLRVAVGRLGPVIDGAEALSDQLEQVGVKTGMPALNSITLAAAMQGVYGKDAQEIATNLGGQIAEVKVELGKVLSGGYAPMDATFKLSNDILNSTWTHDTLHKAFEYARRNSNYTINAMDNAVPAGTSGSNPYYTPPVPAPAGGRGGRGGGAGTPPSASDYLNRLRGR